MVAANFTYEQYTPVVRVMTLIGSMREVVVSKVSAGKATVLMATSFHHTFVQKLATLKDNLLVATDMVNNKADVFKEAGLDVTHVESAKEFCKCCTLNVVMEAQVDEVVKSVEVAGQDCIPFLRNVSTR